jgi:hypothetical protein
MLDAFPEIGSAPQVRKSGTPILQFGFSFVRFTSRPLRDCYRANPDRVAPFIKAAFYPATISRNGGIG